MSNVKRYDEIDILKGIAITFVLLGHSIILFPINLHNINWCQALFNFVSLVHIPLFFLVSGFCYKHIDSYEYFQYLIKKVKRLLIPYLVFSMIDILPRVLLPHLINRPLSFSEGFEKILFYGGEFWFLYTLFAIFLIFPIIQKLTKNNPWLQMTFFIAFLTLQFVKLDFNVFTTRLILHYLLYFYIGYLIKIYFDNIKCFYLQNIKNISKILCVLLLCLWMTISVKYFSSPYFNFIGTIAGLVCSSLMVLENSYKIPAIIFKNIGIVSLQLYLFNGIFLVLSRTIFVSLCGIENAFFIILLNMIITLGLSYFVIIKLFMRFKITRVLTGSL